MPATEKPLTVALGDANLVDAVGPIDGVEFVVWDLRTPSPRPAWDLVVPPYLDKATLLTALNGLTVGLVQSQSIGYDGVADSLPSGIPFANAASVHETSTAELALGLTIAAQRGIDQAVRDADAHRWNPGFRNSLADRRVLLLGYGGVGQAIEARLIPFEVEIVRVARSARDVTDPHGRTVHIHGIDELPALLPAAEIVIIAVPLDGSTRGLVSAAELAALPEGALVVNVARGSVVDTDALVAELSSGRLRAALDVTDPEPLPADHPLYTCPNLILTPHLGGDSSAMAPRIGRLIRRQIDRMRAGEPPVNIVIEGR